MVTQIELMALRENGIGELVERLRERSRGFKSPPILVIGGYALRAYVPIARYSRDCDFALPKGKGSYIDKVESWFPDLVTEAKEKLHEHAYLRLIQLLAAGKHKIQISLDFMESEIRGRRDECVLIDARFVSDGVEASIQIGDRNIPIRIPSYQDYFVLKLMSARPSDTRDIVALVWKKGIPESDPLIKRIGEIVTTPDRVIENLDLIIKDVSHPRFLDSWRGTFITQEFKENDRAEALKRLRALKKAMRREG